MLKWAVILLVVSVIAGALGFSGIAAGARKIALILFGVSGLGHHCRSACLGGR
ncbi:MAG: DUF1328 domain-containing protein [Rhodoplanes sp.]